MYTVSVLNVWHKGVGKKRKCHPASLLPYKFRVIFRRLPALSFSFPERFQARAIQLAVDKLFPIHRHVRQLLLSRA